MRSLFVLCYLCAHAAAADIGARIPLERRAAVAETPTRAVACGKCGPLCQCGPACDCSESAWSWHCAAAPASARAAALRAYSVPQYTTPLYVSPSYVPAYRPYSLSAPQAWQSAPAFGDCDGDCAGGG